jgi:hypothetical protein
MRPEAVDRLLGDTVGNVEFDAEFVAARGQFAMEALDEAVEAVGEEENAHDL